MKNLAFYQAKNGVIELKAGLDVETIWASQKQITQIFDVTSQDITIHLKQIFTGGELEGKSTCKASLQVQKEGNRAVKRNIQKYNLDVIIAIGYRVNSVLGAKFRIWATKTLKQHIAQGYTINKNHIEKNYQTLMNAMDDIKLLVKSKIEIKINSLYLAVNRSKQDLIDLILLLLNTKNQE